MMMMMIMIMVTKTRTAKIYPILNLTTQFYVLGITFIISIFTDFEILRSPNFHIKVAEMEFKHYLSDS